MDNSQDSMRNPGIETGQRAGDKGAQERKPVSKKVRTSVVTIVLVALLAGGIAAAFWYYGEQQKYVYSESASISAPLIQLTPKTGGILKEVMVYDGQEVDARQTVVRVGDTMITTEIPGKILMVKRDIGAVYNPGQTVATMIDPAQMRVIARIPEDKGLKYIHTMEKVLFTVDAYGSQKFEGFVEEVSENNSSGDVVFNISDKRQEQEYEVKIRYDLAANPQFLNGMSAKVWIYK